MLGRTAELIREIAEKDRDAAAGEADRLALLLWAGLHGVVSLQINKPTIDWPQAEEMAEQMMRAIVPHS